MTGKKDWPFASPGTRGAARSAASASVRRPRPGPMSSNRNVLMRRVSDLGVRDPVELDFFEERPERNPEGVREAGEVAHGWVSTRSMPHIGVVHVRLSARHKPPWLRSVRTRLIAFTVCPSGHAIC